EGRRPARALLVAGEGVAAERPAERGARCGSGIEGRGDRVAPLGQRIGKAGEAPERLVLRHADDDAARPPARAGKEDELSGFAGEAQRIRPIAVLVALRRAPGG